MVHVYVHIEQPFLGLALIFSGNVPASVLQLNLKFEIEVLCKNLSLDINELKPGNLLKDKDKLKNLEEQLSAPKKESKAPEETLAVSTAGGTPACWPSAVRPVPSRPACSVAPPVTQL